MKWPYMYIAAFALGIVMLLPLHVDGTFGLLIFEYFNLPIYSKADQSGFHVVNLTGILMLAIGIAGITSSLQWRYPSILKMLLASAVCIIVLTPLLIRFSLIMYYYQSESERSVYIPDQICEIEIVDNDVNALCHIQIMNYGKSDAIEIAPFVLNSSYSIQLDNKVIYLKRHFKQENKISFSGKLLQPTEDKKIQTLIYFDKVRVE